MLRAPQQAMTSQLQQEYPSRGMLATGKTSPNGHKIIGKMGRGVLPGPPAQQRSGPVPGQLQRSGSINLKQFEALLDQYKVDPGEVSVKEAYQFFKRIESQRDRKSLDSSPAVVLSLMRDQLTLLRHKRGDSFRSSNNEGSTRSIIPPPPSRSPSTSSLAPALARTDSDISMLQRSPSSSSMFRGSQGEPPRASRQVSNSQLVIEEMRSGLDQARNLVNGLMPANPTSSPSRMPGRKQLPPPPQRPPTDLPPSNEGKESERGGATFVRRHSETAARMNQEKAPGFLVERHSMSNSPIKKKPPPPSNPPPILRRNSSNIEAPGSPMARLNALSPLAKQNSFQKPPPPSLMSFGQTRPKTNEDNLNEDSDDDDYRKGLLDIEQQNKQNTSDSLTKNPSPHSKKNTGDVSSGNLGSQNPTTVSASTEREMFKLREKLTALENQVVREQNEKERLRNHLLQAQRELHMSDTNLKEVEESLKGIRDRVASNEKVIAEQKDKIKGLQLEQKTSLRKSHQRFDAAIDFMKGLLVDTKFESLVQTLKSRLRMIVGAERAEIYIVDRQAEELIAYRERSGSRRPLPNGSSLWKGRFPMDAGIVGSVIHEKTMQVVQDVEKDVRFDALVDGIGSNGVRSLVVYPILMRQEVVATVVVVNKLSSNGRITGDAFSTQDINTVQDFATLTTLVFLQQQIHKTRMASTSSIRKLDVEGSDAEEESDSEEYKNN